MFHVEFDWSFTSEVCFVLFLLNVKLENMIRLYNSNWRWEQKTNYEIFNRMKSIDELLEVDKYTEMLSMRFVVCSRTFDLFSGFFLRFPKELIAIRFQNCLLDYYLIKCDDAQVTEHVFIRMRTCCCCFSITWQYNGLNCYMLIWNEFFFSTMRITISNLQRT